MDAAILVAQLPPHTELPSSLKALCDFTTERGSDVLGAGIALTPNGPDDLESWTRLAPSLSKSLFVFARDISHALFALWMREGTDLEACPVVRLDSEGVDNRVIACNPSNFAWAVADGRIGDTDGMPVAELQAWFAGRLVRPSEAVRPSWATDEALEAWIDAALSASNHDSKI